MDTVTIDAVPERPLLTETAFTRLLAWLDDGIDSHGERYLDMRNRLVAYFDRRNRRFADELADETLTRVGRTLETSGSIAVTPPARYCYVVARFVLLEDIRRQRRYVSVEEDRLAAVAANEPVVADDTATTKERRLECLDRCLDMLKPDQRELAIEYYRDAKRQRIDRRRGLAMRLGISINALGIRACRIRGTLESCVGSCCHEAMKGFGASGPITASRPFRMGHAIHG
jgi:DNA-directed RNA polymerase specialized sigma24 family protein